MHDGECWIDGRQTGVEPRHTIIGTRVDTCADGLGCDNRGSGSDQPVQDLPTGQDTDRLAADLSTDRTGWDGRPLDEIGRRLYGLRESGYTGWIDQDGYPSTGLTDGNTTTLEATVEDTDEI